MSKVSARPSRENRPSKTYGKSSRQRRAEELARQRARKRAFQISGFTVSILIIAAIVALIVVNGSKSASKSSAAPSIGQKAPNGTFSTLTGSEANVSSLYGKPVLLWFVTTWCSSCQAGTQTMANYIQKFSSKGVRVIELELAGDLGQNGPSISQFANQLAGPQYKSNNTWTFGTASSTLTTTYDPNGDLDVYYLLNPQGKIVYVNSSPSSTIPQLMAQVSLL